MVFRFSSPSKTAMRMSVLLPLVAVALLLTACQSMPESRPASEAAVEPSDPVVSVPEPDGAQAFAQFSESLIDDLLDLNPDWAVYQGHYENAGRLTVPDAGYRRRMQIFVDAALARLDDFDPEAMAAGPRADYALVRNRLESMRWYQETFRNWQWMPNVYNVAGTIAVLLNTEFAPEDERLRLVLERLDAVPAYYRAARANISDPTIEHTELAMTQNQGGLDVFGEELADRVRRSGLSMDEKARFEQARTAAVAAIERHVDWLETLRDELSASGDARSFRIGADLYESKFAFDIQADFSASELYQRALAERDRLHRDMDSIAVELWPRYFPDDSMPDAALVRIGRLIDRLSDRHVAVEDFVEEIRRQIPELAAFVREKDLLDQDPDKPLVVRETPEYLRGSGAIASVSAPGPFNPGAETYYNVTPLETYGEAQAASYLREYNHWILQVLNIHEAIPGHYTQLLHANRSPSLIKSLFGNGAMIEGWAVYAERMMLEQGWADNEPEMWLMYGKWALRVTYNAILDYSVQVLGMGRDEAIRLMREEAFQEQSEATQKWRRLTLSQVQLTSYFSGYAEIIDFRERLKARRGSNFDLKAFHNEFLSYGSAPVAVIVDLMTE